MRLRSHHSHGLVHLTLHNILVGGAALVLCSVAFWDIVLRTVSDRSTAALGVAGIILRLLDGTLLIAGAIALTAFAAAWLIWSRGWLGGGDVKLLPATMVLVPPPLQLTELAVMGYVGGAIGLLYLLVRQFLRPNLHARPTRLLHRIVRVEIWRLARGGGIPYAVAIAAGALGALASEGFSL